MISDMNVPKSTGIYKYTGQREVESRARKDVSDIDFDKITMTTYLRIE